VGRVDGVMPLTRHVRRKAEIGNKLVEEAQRVRERRQSGNGPSAGGGEAAVRDHRPADRDHRIPPGGYEGPQPALGRLRAIDERDRNYQLPRRVSAAAGLSSKHWLSRGPVLDQGDSPRCVAFAGVKWLLTHPVVNHALDTGELYAECQKRDEWEGEDYDGTSVRALFKCLRDRGLVPEYRWAWDIQPVVQHLLSRGPVVVGTDWHLDMFTPDRHGYIWPTGPVVGGHAYMLNGVSKERLNPDGTKGTIRIINSWGPGWAEKGRAWITIGAMDALIRAYGEACTATEVKVRV
jgi:hypothetical protein